MPALVLLALALILFLVGAPAWLWIVPLAIVAAFVALALGGIFLLALAAAFGDGPKH